MFKFAQVLQATGRILNQETVYTTALQTDLLLIQPLGYVFQAAEFLPLVINSLKCVLRDALRIIGQITLHTSVLLNAQITQTCMRIT